MNIHKSSIYTMNVWILFIFAIGVVCSFLLSGCSLKLHPIRNTDAQVEVLRQTAIKSYKDGMDDMYDMLQPSIPALKPYEFEEYK